MSDDIKSLSLVLIPPSLIVTASRLLKSPGMFSHTTDCTENVQVVLIAGLLYTQVAQELDVELGQIPQPSAMIL